MPSIIDSYNTAKYSWKAGQNLKEQLKNAKTINKQNKLQDRINKHDSIWKNHLYFQGSNRILQDVIKDSVIEEKSSHNE